MEISNIAKIISFLTVLFLAIIPSIQSLPALCPAVKEDVTSNEKKEFIVILKADADTNNHFDILNSCLGRVVKKFDPFSFEPSSETDGNEVLDISTEEISTYIGHFNPDFANNVLAKFDEVEILEESIEVGTDMSITESRTEQSNLDRIDTAKRVLDGFYDYPSSAGKGVNIYVVDSGVRITHDEFEGRARYGGYFCEGCTSADDEFGHGTHVSGIAAGKTYGVAKLATIISVRVFNKTGDGITPDMLKSLAFVLKSHKKDPSKKSIVNMSFHTHEFSKAMEKYILTLTENGIHVVVSAGNRATSACIQTPAAAKTAITVGATDQLTDQIADFSNFGKCVDIYAPGVNVTSAFNSNDHDTSILFGTSMATPHVSGTVALIISTFGNKSPADMANYVRSLSTKNVVTKIPDNINNFLLRVPH